MGGRLATVAGFAGDSMPALTVRTAWMLRIKLIINRFEISLGCTATATQTLKLLFFIRTIAFPHIYAIHDRPLD